ncbi:MAG: hypothetical protein Q9191_004340 [Dirinaria sp. TL-2023a]
MSLNSMPRRMTSNASSIVVPRTVSPYHGPAGPSHPYAMYNQDIGVGRTPSNATNSTARTPLRSYTGPSGPSHPYGMYAQNTVSEDDVSAGAEINPALPLGFAGAGHRYQRHLGPEGEDADDIIGPDGHTEQLPPYTRYPNNVPPEDDRIEPLGNTSDPFADSQNTPNTSPTEYVHNTNPLPVNASTAMDSAPEVPRSADEGGHYKEVPSARSKRRKCGVVPLWILVVAISILVAVVVGSVVGAAIHRHHDPHDQPEPQEQESPLAAASTVTVTTSLMDAQPLASTPSNLPPAPTGSFLLSMQNSSKSKADCLSSDASQGNAWACANGLKINIQLGTSAAGHFQAQIIFESPPNLPIRYGPQPPNMSRPADLRLVTDQGGADRGPAYFFQQLYDKVVIVRESEFANVNSKRWHDHVSGRHEIGELEERHWFQENVASPTDRPWYCFWNNTAIEGFIYINEGTNGVSSVQSTFTTAPSSALYGSLESLATSMFKNQWASAAPQVTPPPVPVPSLTVGKRQDTGTPFPKVFKLEELRGPRRKSAYCQQMEISSNNSPSPLPGQYVQLNESEPSTQARVSRHTSWSSPRRRRDDGSLEKKIVRDDDDDDDDDDPLVSSCGCEWLNQ